MFLHTWSAIASTLAQEELEHKCSTINKYRKKKKTLDVKKQEVMNSRVKQ